MVCCDTCPYAPTCEEIEDFERDVLRLHDEWGEEPDSGQAPELDRATFNL